MRLDRLLANLSICSRRECARFLNTGRVTVDGVPARKPDMNVDDSSGICIDGKPLDTRTERNLIMNKPAGVITADDDPRCATVMDLLPPVYRTLGCMPVGRLDKDTTGILLFTTDGQLAHRLISPRCAVPKVYLARVEGELNGEDVRAFEEGIRLKDFCCLPARLEIIENDLGQVTVFEGKYHQVKRMFQSRGKTVLKLKRVSFGPFALPDDLHEGNMRELTEEETARLYAVAYGKETE